jgi:hypothetical protein
LPSIIRNLPFFDRSTMVDVRRRTISVSPDQIVVWVSISELGQATLDPQTPRFPAVVDTGCNHSFVLREQHLVEWAGIHTEYLRRLRPTRIHGSVVPQLAANVWLHPNLPGQRDGFGGRPAFQIECESGIAIVPTGVNDGSPRLPLLGLRAFRRNGLQLNIDGHRQRVTVRTRRRFWILG